MVSAGVSDFLYYGSKFNIIGFLGGAGGCGCGG